MKRQPGWTTPRISRKCVLPFPSKSLKPLEENGAKGLHGGGLVLSDPLCPLQPQMPLTYQETLGILLPPEYMGCTNSRTVGTFHYLWILFCIPKA